MNEENKPNVYFALALSSVFTILNIHAITYIIYDNRVLLLFIAIIARIIISLTIDIKNLSHFAIWIYLEIGYFSYTTLSLVLSAQTIPLSKPTLLIATIGLMILAISFLISKKLPISKKRFVMDYNKISACKTKLFFVLFIIFAFAISFTSDLLGVSKLGIARTILPYKLEPAFNLTRNFLVPYFFIFFIDIFFEKKSRKWLIFSLILFFAWLMLEMISTGSRGILMSKIILIIILLIPKINFRKTIIVLLIAGFVFPLFFKVGNFYRLKYTINPTLLFSDHISQTGTKSTIWAVYQRVFYDPILIDKFYRYVGDNIFVNNFSNYNKYDGGVNFHTVAIDGADSNRHSSGISGITDGYLLGGIVGAALAIVILIVLATINDLGLFWFIRISHASKAIITFWIINTMMLAEGLFSHILYRSLFTNAVFPCFLFSIFILSKYILIDKTETKSVEANLMS